MSATSTEELSDHKNAYLQIFSSVLNKKNGDPARKKQIYAALQNYLNQKVHNVDEFIDHIPQFARALAVPEQTLASYIGANFLKALDLVHQKKAASPANVPASPSGTPSGPAPGIFDELIHYSGPTIPPGSRFIPSQFGLMTLVGPDGAEIQAVSASGAVQTEISPAETEKPPSSRPEIQKVTVARPEKKPSGNIFEKESSIIEELLQKFGNVLDIPGKLEPNSGPPETIPERQESVSAPEASASPSSPEHVTPAVRSAKKQSPEPERPLIQEILEKFGNVLDIPGKLEPSSGLPEDSSPHLSPEPAASSAAPIGTSSSATSSFEPIPMRFGEYMAAVRKIYEFQSQNDRVGYQVWLKSAGPAVKSMTGIRNLFSKERKGTTVNWHAELESISRYTGFSGDALRDLRARLQTFEKIQSLIQRLTASLKQPQNKEIMNAVKSVWGQIRLLFDEPASFQEMSSRLKIVLLQIQDPAVKAKIQNMIAPYLKKASEIFGK